MYSPSLNNCNFVPVITIKIQSILAALKLPLHPGPFAANPFPLLLAIGNHLIFFLSL